MASESVLEALVTERRRFEAFIKSRVPDPDLAEDLVQTAFLKALRSSGTLEDGERVTAWFYRILRNVLTDHWRRQGAEARAVERIGAAEPGPVSEPELEAEVCACVGSLLDTLPDPYGMILRLVELEERSPAEAAEALGLSPGNARVRLHRARAALRERVEDLCRACARHGCLDCTCRATPAPPEV